MTTPLPIPDSADLSRYQDMRSWFVEYCEICDCQQVFLVGGLGLMACCQGCGDAPFIAAEVFTRSNSEA